MSLIKCPVQLLQDEWELERLLGFYQEINPKNVLEIGSFFGGTLWYWIRYATDLKKIVSVDLEIARGDVRWKQMIKSKKEWDSWIPNGCEFKKVTSNSMHESIILYVQDIFKNKDCDWLFIDGGHDYNTVLSDYTNYSQCVRKGGIIVFHDILHEYGVVEAWKKVRYKKRTIEINNQYGIGIVYAD